MPLQQIRPDFSGSAQSMQDATRNVAQVGSIAGEALDRIRQEKKDAQEEARYQTEQARLKILDERAAEQWKQQQDARIGTIEAERIANDPNIAKALGVRQGTELSQRFQQNLAPQEAILRDKMAQRIATSPEAQKAMAGIQAEDGTTRNMQLSAEGQWVPMSAQDMARQTQLEQESALQSTGLVGGLGIDQYKKGAAAYELAMQPTTAEQVQQIATTTPTPITTQVPISKGTLVKTSEGTQAKPAQMTDEQWLLEHPKLAGSLYAKPVVPTTPTTTKEDKGLLQIGKDFIANGGTFNQLPAAIVGTLMAAKKEYTANREKTSTSEGRAKALNEYVTRGKGVEPIAQAAAKAIEPTIPAEFKKIVGTPAGKQFLLDAMERIKDPATREVMVKDYREKTTGTKGTAPTYDRVGAVYKNKVTTFGGKEPISVQGMPTGSKTAIVDAYKIMNDAVGKIGVHQEVTDAAKSLMAGIGKKYGVTQKEMGTPDILKASGLDGTLTPKQERMIDSLKNATDAAVKQYTANQGQANADRTFNLQVAQLQQQVQQHAESLSLQRAKLKQDDKNAKIAQSEFAKTSEREAAKYMTKEKYLTPAERITRDAAAIEALKTGANTDRWFQSVNPWAMGTSEASKKYGDTLVARARQEQGGILSKEDEAAIRAGL